MHKGMISVSFVFFTLILDNGLVIRLADERSRELHPLTLLDRSAAKNLPQEMVKRAFRVKKRPAWLAGRLGMPPSRDGKAASMAAYFGYWLMRGECIEIALWPRR